MLPGRRPMGLRKKENSIITDRTCTDIPQLSNEMQLSIMNKVKSGELSIEDALSQARRDRKLQFQQQSQSTEDKEDSQYNFSVHKHNRYRWQKRVLQIDLSTRMLCSIEKGIVKRQLPFASVRSCEDGTGARFSISFQGHHDYELEATSLGDKQKIMQLVNTVIYHNIYGLPGGGAKETRGPSLAPESVLEGQLMLLKGGLASFKWQKYDVKLHPGQLTLVPPSRRGASDDTDEPPAAPLPVVIHLSDGDARVEKARGSDAFALHTHKNEYQFRIPVTDRMKSPEASQLDRDAWVQAIDKLCSDWKRKSLFESTYGGGTAAFHHPRDTEEKPAGRGAERDLPSGGETYLRKAPVPKPRSPASLGMRAPLIRGSPASPDPALPTPRTPPGPLTASSPVRTDVPAPGSPVVPAPRSPLPVSVSPSPTSPVQRSPVPNANPVPIPPGPHPASPDPVYTSSSPPSATPTSPAPVTPTQVAHPPPPIPPPPPLPAHVLRSIPASERTRAFHWDLVNSEKIGKSFWMLESTGKIEIDTSRLYEQFAVQDVGTFGGTPESSNNNLHIMLDQKIAHNFSIFLKSFPVQPGKLKEKLYVVNEDEGGLSDEHIASLRRYVPTSDDVEMYQSYKGTISELHIVDQYMMEMCDIQNLSTQLDLLLTLRELPTSMEDLQPLINQKIRMCTQLLGSRSFVSVLECLLAIGNYLNENAGKGKAAGFRLSTLTKLSQLRGKDRKFTLLCALVEQILFHQPALATFFQELAEFETVPGASIKGLTAEVDVLKNELQKVIQYRKSYKKGNQGDQHAKFSKDLKAAIEKYKTDLSLLTKGSEEMKKRYADILAKFGEPRDQDSQELFGTVCQFVNDFKTIHAQMTGM